MKFFPLTLVLFFACQGPTADGLADNDYTFQLLHEKYGLDVKVAIDQEGQQNIDPESETVLRKYLADRFSDEFQIKSIDELEIAFYQAAADDVTSRKVTVVSKVTSAAGNTHPIAVEFDPLRPLAKAGSDVPGGPYVGGVEHTCLGKPCNCCGFIYESSGWNIFIGNTSYKVVGCKCKESPADCATEGGSCDHKISTAP